jgi:hypothetical protein
MAMPDQRPPRSWLTSEVETDPLLLADAHRVFNDRGGGINGALAVRRLLDDRLRRMVTWPRALDYDQLADDLAGQGHPEQDTLLLRCAATSDFLLAEAQTRWNTRYDTRPETTAGHDTQPLIDAGLLDLDPNGPHPGIDGAQYWPGYTSLETGHQAPVILIINRGLHELVTGFPDQTAVNRWLHNRGPTATGSLTSPDVPVLPRTTLEEHILARLLNPHADLPARSTDAPPTTFTTDTRYDIYAAITTLARVGQRPTPERAAAELSRRIDWTPEWALPAYGGHGAPWASTYLHRLAMTEPTTFTLQRLVASDAAARLASIGQRSAEPEVQRPLPTTEPQQNTRRADVPRPGQPSPSEGPPLGQRGRAGPSPKH